MGKNRAGLAECIRGHRLTETSGKDGRCRECARIVFAAWYEKNHVYRPRPAKGSPGSCRFGHARIVGRDCPPCRAEARAQLKRDNPDLVRSRRTARRHLKVAYDAAYYRKNKATLRAYYERWKAANRPIVAAVLANYRARKRAAAGSCSASEWAAIVRKQRGRCVHCNRKAKLDRDHIVPLSLGGSNFAFNIQGLCRSCNCKKRDHLLADARPSLFDREVAV